MTSSPNPPPAKTRKRNWTKIGVGVGAVSVVVAIGFGVLQYVTSPAAVPTLEAGDGNVVVGTPGFSGKLGAKNTVVGATDANGNTILNKADSMAIGDGASAGPRSIAIGAGARAGGGGEVVVDAGPSPH